MVEDILLISNLNTFMGSVYPFVPKPMFCSSLNSSDSSPFLSQVSIFRTAVLTCIYSTELYVHSGWYNTDPLKLTCKHTSA